MDYDTAVGTYIRIRDEVDAAEARCKEEVAGLKEQMNALSAWLQLKSEQDGLEKVSTKHGLVYWSTIGQASVADRSAFMDFVRETGAFELLETRCSKTAVQQYLEANDRLPPGVNYRTIRQINVRRSGK